MKNISWLLLFALFIFGCEKEQKQKVMDPNKIQYNTIVHKKLSNELLERIKNVTNVFEIIDGITYEKAVDLYKRDFDPESNIVIWEEMVRVYKIFCKNRCKTHPEKVDVYKALLLRSMFSDSEALSRLERKVISENDAKTIMKLYKLKAKPIEVYKK